MRSACTLLAAALSLACGSNAPEVPQELSASDSGCAAPDYPSEGLGSEPGSVVPARLGRSDVTRLAWDWPRLTASR